MSFSKPLLAEPAIIYHSDPKQLGSGCKKYSSQQRSSSSSTEPHILLAGTKFTPPSSFAELDAEISAFKCSAHHRTCSRGRGGCFGRNFFSDSQVRATEMLQILSIYREKTRKLNKQDLEQYVLNNIFKKHCTNIDEVINQTREEHGNLFGDKDVVVDEEEEVSCRRSDDDDDDSTADDEEYNPVLSNSKGGGDHCNCSISRCSELSCSGSGGRDVLQSKRKFLYCYPSSSKGEDQPSKKKVPASSSICKKKKTAPEKRFEYDWSLSIDSGILPDPSQTKLKLCVASICFLYGISPNQIKRCAKKMKTFNTSDIISARSERGYNHRSYFGDDFSMEDVCRIFDDNGLDVGVMEQRAALVRSSSAHIDAMLWMENYFFQFESQPNSKQIHVDFSYKRTIYEEYHSSANPSAPANKLSEGNFKELWSSLYDFVKIRKSKRISGKCWTCAYINELRQKQKGEEADSVIGRYERLRVSEFARLKRLQGKRLKEIIIRKVKDNGAKYPHSGTIEKLSSLIFTCDLQFTSMRLEPTTDVEQRQLINDIFEGGIMRNLNANSIVVTINNKYPMDVKCMQSLKSDQFLSEKAMDAFLELCAVRDSQLVTAFNEVNIDKAGYITRLGSTYLNSQFSSLLMQSDLSVEELLRHDLVQALLQNHTIQKSYRTVIPILWKGGGDHHDEWFLIILDTSNHTVNFIFTRFSAMIESPISDDSKAALIVNLREKLEVLLSPVTIQQQQQQQPADDITIGEPNIEQQPPIPWTFVNYFNSATEDQPVDSQRRIPLTHNHGVPEK
eukprot:gene21534-27882_t